MSGGFWAGSVPPWAYVALVVLVILVIGGIALGAWYGYGRGWKHAEEEVRWAREQAKARHPGYMRGYRLSVNGQQVYDWQYDDPEPFSPEIAHEAWLAHEDQALTLANGPIILPDSRELPITTGEIQAITDEMDAWLATHVYAAPADYGQWLEQVDDHGVPDG